MCSIVLRINKSISIQYISLPKNTETEKKKIQRGRKAQWDEKGRRWCARLHTLNFRHRGEKKKKKKRKASWVVGGSRMLFLAYSKERRHISENNTITTTKSRRFPSVLCQWVTRRTVTYTQLYKLRRPPPCCVVGVTCFLTNGGRSRASWWNLRRVVTNVSKESVAIPQMHSGSQSKTRTHPPPTKNGHRLKFNILPWNRITVIVSLSMLIPTHSLKIT